MLPAVLRLLLILAAVGAVLYATSPALEGYHLGFNSQTDNAAVTRLGIQWGKYDPACVGLPQGSHC